MIYEGLKNNTTLKFLDISCNKVPEEVNAKIRAIIERNRS